MANYPLTYVDGHLFVQLDGAWYLLDTGSPFSIGERGSVHYGGREFPVQEAGGGVDMPMLRQFIQQPFYGLLGGDVLGAFPFTIDLHGGVLRVDDVGSTKLSSEMLPLTFCMGVPAVTAMFAGTNLTAYIDTGASISYVPAGLVEGQSPNKEAQDFYPGLDTFTTPIYPVAVLLGRLQVDLHAGLLPDLLGSMLEFTGVDGILGNELFLSYQATFDYEHKSIWLSPFPV